METKKTITQTSLLCLVLGAVLSLGSCSKNQVSNINPLNSQTSTPALNIPGNATASLATVAVYAIDVSTLRLDTGYCYKAGLIPFAGDSSQEPTGSTLRLFENGVELGPAHIFHDDIRRIGRGSFSHWKKDLFFSASDNTNPLTNGRKYTYTLAGKSTGTNAGLVGYAAVNGTTTGGMGGQSITVTTLAALKKAVAGSTPKIVYVRGAIKGLGFDPVYVGSNTSIIGETGSTLEGINLFLFTVNNVILQDLTVRNYLWECSFYVKFQSRHIWIDHCDFATDRKHGWDYWGKDIGITEGSDLVTISWCKFHDTNLSVLIGSVTSNALATNTGQLHVTLHHNFWYNTSEREPALVFGTIHMFNNYHLNNGGYSIGARFGGTVRTDNEYFSGCIKPLTTNLDGDPAGRFSGITTNIYSNCGANDITSSISTWVPAYSYSSFLDPAASVPSIVQAGAGSR